MPITTYNTLQFSKLEARLVNETCWKEAFIFPMSYWLNQEAFLDERDFFSIYHIAWKYQPAC